VFANGVIVAVVSFGQSWVCASPGYYTRVDNRIGYGLDSVRAYYDHRVMKDVFPD
jgi:hypothetical protein